jgi:hypothetical protein
MHLRMFSAIVVGLALSAAASAQDSNSAPPAQNQQPGAGGGWQGRRGGAWGGGMGQGRGVMGTVTEVAADHYTIKTETGELYTVHFSANTHIVKAPAHRRGDGGAGAEGGNPPPQLKPADIKVGDAITAGGELDTNAKSVGAVFIALIDPEQAQRMREMEANFGKTWLAGKVTAIDGVKVTLQGGPGNATHTFVADENTTFRKRRDPITLADVQVGDNVRVEGSVKDGTFVAATVGVMGMQGPPQGPAPGPPPGGPR